jgi:hypothetical protein
MNYFDWHYYLDKYPDLRTNGITTEQQAIQHWLNHGKKEGRVSIKTPQLFDWHYYLDKYPDLRTNGITTEQQAIQHWLDHGNKEGRVSIKTPHNFDWHYYLNNYSDLRSNGINSEQKAIQHWVDYGKKEGRNTQGTKCGFAISTYHRNDSRLDSFTMCISSIMKYKKPDTVVIIVDDGSLIKNHLTWVSITFPDIIIVEKPTNNGISKCKNTCLRMLYENNCDYFFLLDDDIEILQPIEDKYINSLYDDKVSILSGRAESNPVVLNYSKNTNQTNHLNGYVLCFSKLTFMKSGYFKVFPCKYGHEHTWYTHRVMSCTNQIGYFDIASNEFYIKLISVESSINDEQRQYEFGKNQHFLNIYNTDYENCIE